jgi:ATP-binding protein involved in chromosome partitioning
VYKSVAMCAKVNIPIVGVVENMSYFIDSAGVRHELFGKGGGQAIADFAKAPLLGQLAIDPAVREWGDKGTPLVKASPDNVVSQHFMQIAEKLVQVLDEKAQNEGGTEDLVIDRSGGPGGKKRLPVTK